MLQRQRIAPLPPVAPRAPAATGASAGGWVSKSPSSNSATGAGSSWTPRTVGAPAPGSGRPGVGATQQSVFAGAGAASTAMPSSAARIQQPDASAGRTVAVSNGTTALVRPGSNLVTIRKVDPGGSEVVVEKRYNNGVLRTVNASKTSRDPVTGAVTTSFLDGRKLSRSNEGTSLSIPGRGRFVSHSSGLREAFGPEGKPVYADRWQGRWENGQYRHTGIDRTVYSETVINRTIVYQRPIVRTYMVVTWGGPPIYAYQPVVFAPVFYDPFMAPFQPSIMVGVGCLVCPGFAAAFSVPVQSYSDPMDLVGDLQISSAVEEGMGDVPPPPDPAAPLADAEVADLRDRVGQLDSEIQNNTAVQAEVGTELGANHPNVAGDDGRTATVRIPEDVRQQIHRQVRDNVLLHQQQRALTWPDLIASGAAKGYVFQVFELMDTADENGEQCSLTTGDLLRLDEATDAGASMLKMRVVTAKATSCRANSVIGITPGSAQEMLNAFNVRQETIMSAVQPQLAANAPR